MQYKTVSKIYACTYCNIPASFLLHLQKLKYHTQIHVRSTRGKNARGRKITGVEPLAGEDKVLSNIQSQ